MTLNPFGWYGARQQRNGAEIPQLARERVTTLRALFLLSASVLAVGCSSKTPEPKDEKKAVPPEWEYVVPSDTSGFTLRVKIDTVRRVLRWIEQKPTWVSVNYEECSEKEVKPPYFWIFDDQNWACQLRFPNGEPRLTLTMRNGQLTRVDSRAMSLEELKRRPRGGFTPFVPSAKP